MLLVLVFIQVGLLFFLQSLKDEAQFRLVKNTSKAELVCGEKQFADENYWSLASENLVEHSECTQGECENSQLQWNRVSQNKELHLISITSPPPFRWEPLDQGGVVKVRVKKSAKTQIIALVSRAPLEWNFEIEKGAVIEKIIVATPTTVWLQGVDAKIPIEYLPKEKMCSYPYAWEEAFNPENEFRVLVGALEKITGFSLNSFQGAQVGREFWIPRSATAKPENSPLGQRGLASVAKTHIPPKPLEPAALSWQRQGGHVVADKFTLSSGELVELPAKTIHALEFEGVLYAVIKGRLNLWNDAAKKFTPLASPLSLPEVSRITAITADASTGRLVLYNDDRSGEFYSLDVKTKKWDLFKDGFKYHVSSIFFDSDVKSLTVLVSRGGFFTALVSFNAEGKESFQELTEKFPFDRKRWQWSLAKDQDQWMVNIYSPLLLTGAAQTLR